jgi:hypothetical protein
MNSTAKKLMSRTFAATLDAATLQLRSTVFADDPTIKVTNRTQTRLTVRIDKGPYTGKTIGSVRVRRHLI